MWIKFSERYEIIDEGMDTESGNVNDPISCFVCFLLIWFNRLSNTHHFFIYQLYENSK